jgi:hypothetical protein
VTPGGVESPIKLSASDLQMTTSEPSSAAINSKLELFSIFNSTQYSSQKHDSYFQVYEQIFRKYVGKPITFVEVGVLNGGSLFMWRKYFGPSARIIGIEINPIARKWEQDGFEIFIGSQSDPLFWDEFYRKVGPIDVLLDDGGHTNLQQVITAHKAISNLRDGGTFVVEDVHTSYWTAYGNPSKYSFVSFAKRILDSVKARFPAVKVVSNDYGKKVFSVCFYESIIVFNIDSTRCFASSRTKNEGITVNAEDLKHKGSPQGAVDTLQKQLAFLGHLPLLWRAQKIYPVLHWLLARVENRKLRRFFD